MFFPSLLTFLDIERDPIGVRKIQIDWKGIANNTTIWIYLIYNNGYHRQACLEKIFLIKNNILKKKEKKRKAEKESNLINFGK